MAGQEAMQAICQNRSRNEERTDCRKSQREMLVLIRRHANLGVFSETGKKVVQID